MSSYQIACSVSQGVTRVLRHPYFVLAFPVLCAAFLAVGWALGHSQQFLLILTTVLSILASWQASMVMMKQARDDGDLD